MGTTARAPKSDRTDTARLRTPPRSPPRVRTPEVGRDFARGVRARRRAACLLDDGSHGGHQVGEPVGHRVAVDHHSCAVLKTLQRSVRRVGGPPGWMRAARAKAEKPCTALRLAEKAWEECRGVNTRTVRVGKNFSFVGHKVNSTPPHP
eukprot:4072824-Pleurochrysis_carterae.AAC.4